MMNKRRLNEELVLILVIFFGVLSAITLLVQASEKNEIEGEITTTTYESETIETIDHNVVIPPANVLPEVTENETIQNEITWDEWTAPEFLPEEETAEEPKPENAIEFDDWDDVNFYLLAKIAMAEAEGESLETKMLVILTVLNRVKSNAFPDTVYDVIFQNRNGVYQFSPVMSGGRWWTTEPNEECWKAVTAVFNLEHDISEGALYFEACKNKNNWHSRNLTFICQSSNTRFYK